MDTPNPKLLNLTSNSNSTSQNRRKFSLFKPKVKGENNMRKIVLKCSSQYEILINKQSSEIQRGKSAKLIESYLGKIKHAVYESNEELQLKVINFLCETKLLLRMALKLSLFNFESIGFIRDIYLNVLLRKITDDRVVTDDLISYLIDGYENKEISATCGKILNKCLYDKEIVNRFVNIENMKKIFTHIKNPEFTTKADAVDTLKFFVKSDRFIKFMENNYNAFMDKLMEILASGVYIHQLYGLNILSSILLDKKYVNITNKYVSDPKNLICIMNLLKIKHKNQFRKAMFLFAVFVINAEPQSETYNIIKTEKEKLITFFNSFKPRSIEDYEEDKLFLLEKLEKIV